MPREYSLQRTAVFRKPVKEVFHFFSQAHNLARVSPPWLNFRILTAAPIEMRTGTQIDYEIRLHGIPIRWQTRITLWEPPHRFVDTQSKGPYKSWVHEHRFEPENGGTRMTDTVIYSLRGGPFAPLLHKYFVQKDLKKIFEYREVIFKELFSG